MKYISICSGIEGQKICPKCKTSKPLSDYHVCNKSKDGKASWCKRCSNTIARASRKRNYKREDKRKWQLKTRYGLTVDQFEKILESQNGVCAICKGDMKRRVVDHNHVTGAVRGILCHLCNIKLHPIEDANYLAAATEYLRSFE